MQQLWLMFPIVMRHAGNSYSPYYWLIYYYIYHLDYLTSSVVIGLLTAQTCLSKATQRTLNLLLRHNQH